MKPPCLWASYNGSSSLGIVRRGNAGPLHVSREQLDLQMPFFPQEPSERREKGDGNQPWTCYPKESSPQGCGRARSYQLHVLLAVQKTWSLPLFSSLLPGYSEPSLFSWSQNRSLVSSPLRFFICKLGMMWKAPWNPLQGDATEVERISYQYPC